MRQVMPHRNNMCMRRSEGKPYLRFCAGFHGSATNLQQTFDRPESSSENNIIRNKSLRAAWKVAIGPPERIGHS